MDVTPQIFSAIRKGRITVPLGKRSDLAEVGGLPCCSIATLHADGEKLHRLVGPAIRQKDQWAFPVLFQFFDPATELADYEKEAEKLRKSWGMLPVFA